MQDLKLLRDSAAIKALGHPLRLKLLEELIREAASVQQLADRMREVHAKLFYHVKELEKNGLIEVVGEQQVNGITERFYRATARTFYLGQAVGRFSPAEQTVVSAVHSDLLRQRREQELRINHRAVAHELVCHALQVKPGARVVLEGASHQAELLEAMLLECRLAGAEGFLRLMNTSQIRQMLLELSPEQLATAPPFTTFLYGHTDLWVSLDAVTTTAAFADLDPAKVQAIMEGELKAYTQGPKRFAAVEIGYPTPERALELGMDYALMYDTFWRAISTPVTELACRGRELAAQLQAADHIRIASGADAELELRLKDGADVEINSGQLDYSRVSAERLSDLTLPGGQILFRPQPRSLNGQLFIPRYLHRGTEVQNIRLKFAQGELVAWEAEAGQETLRSLLEMVGNRVAVGKLGLGFNPNVPNLTGYKLLDPVAQNALGVMLVDPMVAEPLDLALPFWLYAENTILDFKEGGDV
jgi:leucyl aminopeptidase (aminopeptidase T)